MLLAVITFFLGFLVSLIGAKLRIWFFVRRFSVLKSGQFYSLRRTRTLRYKTRKRIPYRGYAISSRFWRAFRSIDYLDTHIDLDESPFRG
jgi:hypothetical protein